MYEQNGYALLFEYKETFYEYSGFFTSALKNTFFKLTATRSVSNRVVMT